MDEFGPLDDQNPAVEMMKDSKLFPIKNPLKLNLRFNLTPNPKPNLNPNPLPSPFPP
jgi:hypothetical protein